MPDGKLAPEHFAVEGMGEPDEHASAVQAALE
jgi:hypothetical protein